MFVLSADAKLCRCWSISHHLHTLAHVPPQPWNLWHFVTVRMRSLFSVRRSGTFTDILIVLVFYEINIFMRYTPAQLTSINALHTLLDIFCSLARPFPCFSILCTSLNRLISWRLIKLSTFALRRTHTRMPSKVLRWSFFHPSIWFSG